MKNNTERFERIERTIADLVELNRRAEEQRLKNEQAWQEERLKNEQAWQEERLKNEQAWEERHRRAEEQRLKNEQAWQEEHRKTEELYHRAEEQRLKNEQAWQEEHRKTERIVQQTNKRLGNIGNAQGDEAEDLFRRALMPQMKSRDITLDYFYYRFGRLPGHEFDLVGIQGKYVVLGEVKYRLLEEDVKKLVNKQIAWFRDEHPEYDHLKLIGLVAGIIVDTKVEKCAEDLGLYVLTQNGEDSATIINSPDFKAKEYSLGDTPRTDE